MCSYRLICVDSNIAKFIKKDCPPVKFENSFHIFYKEQVPNVGVLLLQGGLLMKSKKVKEINSPVVVGLVELLEGLESDCSVELLKGAEACVFDKISLEKYMEQNSEFSKILELT